MDYHFLFDCVAAAVSVGWLIVGLLIKNALADIKLNQANVKSDLLEHQIEMKERLTANQIEMKERLMANHAETKQGLAVHIAEDNQRFGAVDKNIARLESIISKT